MTTIILVLILMGMLSGLLALCVYIVFKPPVNHYVNSPMYIMICFLLFLIFCIFYITENTVYVSKPKIQRVYSSQYGLEEKQVGIEWRRVYCFSIDNVIKDYQVTNMMYWHLFHFTRLATNTKFIIGDNDKIKIIK